MFRLFTWPSLGQYKTLRIEKCTQWDLSVEVDVGATLKYFGSNVFVLIDGTVALIPDAVDTVIRAPDDGWRYHPKHVEQFTDINKPTTLTTGCSNSRTNARCCRYSDMSS
jgi:hypothetical protein